jgi:hypothetical protein
MIFPRVLLSLGVAVCAQAASRPATPLTVPATGRAGFALLDASSTGVQFTNSLADASVARNQVLLNGSGVALGDVDGDGRPDIYLCRLEGPNALYRNLGNWKFEELAASAGVACSNQISTGAVFADVDGDSDLDLLVNSLGAGTRCFFNDGRGHFAENNSGLLRKFCATSMALADIDGNGTLDLYVVNYRTTTIRSTGLDVLTVNGKRMLRPQDRDGYEITPEGAILEHAEPDQLYLNDGKGNFTPVPWNGGTFRDADGKPLARGDKDWGLSVQMRDLNGDGAPDIYVCNDFWSADGIWLNDGRGHFRALPVTALRITSTFSMGVDAADINRDGFDDLFVPDMRSRDHARRMRQRTMFGGVPVVTRWDERPQIERNTLFLNRGDGTFAEIAQLAGVQASEWSWCPVFLDVDLDGFEDLLITTGHGFDSQDSDAEMRTARGPRRKVGESILEYPRLVVPKQAFRNRGDLTFEPAGDAWKFNQPGISHGMALADLDGDGDLDVVVNHLNGAAGLYRNDSPAPRVAARLKGRAGNTRGIGARITVAVEAAVTSRLVQSQEMICGGRYLSGDDAMRVFAAWNATNRFTVTVKWRSGATSVATNVAANALLEVGEPAGAPVSEPARALEPTIRAGSETGGPLFGDVSTVLAHAHRDEPFDDFARQPLLTKRLSHGGPGVTWSDVDADGMDDLLISGGRGGGLAFYRNAGEGRFQAVPVPPVLARAAADQTAVLAWPDKDGVTLLTGQANYEGGDTNIPGALRFKVTPGGVNTADPLPAMPSSTGPLAAADVDGDGDLDLFVGGQVNPARFPEPASSRLYRNEAGRFVLAHSFDRFGLVNSAVFTDVDGDGFSELLLACDWGALKILRNQQGRFAPWNAPLTAPTNSHLRDLHDLTGWWTSIAAGDFDNDGRMDFVAGNWGRNHPWQPFAPAGLRLYFGDFSGAGGVDGVEAYVENGRELPWRDLDTVARALPPLRGKFSSYAEYAGATLADVLGAALPTATRLDAVWFDTTLFLNRGGRFEARSLPLEAQLSPVFGIVVGDFDGDGNEDLFLAQNFFPTDAETSRYDAGRGLLLRGDGRGGFSALSRARSGIEVPGDARGAAAADYDGDGRLDLAVGQNSADTKLFRNERARPGLRVSLRGPAENRAGFGAVIRRGNGPAHERHAGSGWWSQNSATAVLGGSGTSVSVRWPGGRETTTNIPPGATSVVIDAPTK